MEEVGWECINLVKEDSEIKTLNMLEVATVGGVPSLIAWASIFANESRSDGRNMLVKRLQLGSQCHPSF